MKTATGVSNRDHLTAALAAGPVLAPALGLRRAQPLSFGPLDSHTGVVDAKTGLAFRVAALPSNPAHSRSIA